MEYHRPVMLEQCLEGLAIRPVSIYIDATFGGGGHARAILDRLDDKGHLFAFDQDDDARENLWPDRRLTFVWSNFRYLKQYMRYFEVAEVHGVLADLGVSSWQLDQEERGFSYRSAQPLDMRMNKSQGITAADVINNAGEDALIDMFSRHGGIRNSRTLAATICDARQTRQIRNSGEFIDVIGGCVRGNRMRYLSQVFQALRIVVNAEDRALEEFLASAGALLSDGGRMVIMSYHSGEDRIVKHFFKKKYADEQGRNYVIRMINKKPVLPEEQEIRDNIRARSAKLRIAEKYFAE